MARRAGHLQFGVIALALGGCPAWAQTTVTFQDGVSPSSGYAGTRDTTLTNGTRAAATSSGVNAAWVDRYFTRTAVLLRFNVSSLFDDLVVQSASLTYTVTDSTLPSFPLYAMSTGWAAKEATWFVRLTGLAWQGDGASAAGPDYATAPLATLTGAANATRTVAFNAAGVAAVQRWVDDPSSNFGLVTFPSDAGNNAFGLQGCDAVDASSRLTLSIVTSDSVNHIFRDGVSPTPGYGGCAVTTLFNGGTQAQNMNGRGLAAGGEEALTGLVQFDLRTIPASATVQSVTLRLHALDLSGVPEARVVLRPWLESSATFLTLDGSAAWGIPGANGEGDVGPVLQSLQVVNVPTAELLLGDAGVAAVQTWVRDPTTNHGFALTLLSESTFSDREDALPASRPALEVTYLVADAGTAAPLRLRVGNSCGEVPSSALLPGLLLAFVIGRRRMDREDRRRG